MNTHLIHTILSFTAGTFAGSFFYTLALRYAAGDFNASPVQALFSRSKCPACRKAVSPLGLIPVFGFFLLRGRCSSCGERISFMYPFMELLYGSLAILVMLRFGCNFYALTVFLLMALTISISVIDLKTFTIPNTLVIVFILLSLYPVIINASFLDNLYGLILMFLFFLAVLLIFPGSFGGGDLKLASAMGFLLGFELAVVALEASLISGALIGIAYALFTGKGLKSKIAFGPFLCLGLIIAFIWGHDIVVLYYSWIY